jgi:hypothetical protein
VSKANRPRSTKPSARRPGRRPRNGSAPPPWPMDTKDHVFLGRALEQIAVLLESAGQPHDTDAVRMRALSAIERGVLKVYSRIIEDVRETRMGLLNPSAFPPEAWMDFLTHFTAYLVDRRPWISVRHRRRIPQPHWLFVGKDGLEGLEPTSRPQDRPGTRPAESTVVDRHPEQVWSPRLLCRQLTPAAAPQIVTWYWERLTGSLGTSKPKRRP